MDAKDAVKAAKAYVSDLLQDEQIRDLGLEEIEFDGSAAAWSITLGFSRPWSSTNSVAALLRDAHARRDYKVVKVRDEDGTVVSLKQREFAQ
ncbi:hypothetical protein [Mangrovibrevibacter kandeliae]|uniref:hypothetical protein n=1 Tax=Mangrovibrevibacter kandeliae TaxID=2968473 RepID=UPI0021190126|nr:MULTISPECIES: hypothetical protein [unclassified Aurantimonas]MCQ8782773.1 hypothetical protein [Aurantimonas sp. CSK15Z-1]MCW4114419.1 hypothetical protein [Aurantimonas sp. MSK8Z-1]